MLRRCKHTTLHQTTRGAAFGVQFFHFHLLQLLQEQGGAEERWMRDFSEDFGVTEADAIYNRFG